jgi:hypothetical protein
MRLFLFTTLVLINSFAHGQSVHEGFVNETSSLYLQTKPFRLAEEPLPIISFPFTKNQLKEELKSHLPDSALQTIFENMVMDSVSSPWARSLLNDVQLVNQAQIDTLLGTVIIVSDSKNKSTYRKKLKLLKSKRGTVYMLSHPVFDASGKFALMQVSMGCGSGCGEHYFILFKKENDRWIKLIEVYHMMS